MLPLQFQYFILCTLAVQSAVHGVDEVTKTIEYWLPPPGMYAHQVWHEQLQQQQQQQQQQAEQEAQQSELADAPTQEKREKHDIYLNYETPKRLSYGHVEANPERVEQRFGMRDEGNRYKGMVIWADRKGGYGEHSWDLVQGAI